jgi:hypothetical protein
MSFDISALTPDALVAVFKVPDRYMFWCADRNVARHGEFKSDISNMEIPMRKSMTSLLLLAAVIPASAQTASPPPNRDANTPAVNSPNSPPNPGAPVAGANSFTEGQAKSRIEEKGFNNVHDLKRDDAGVWRGKADQNGQAVNVSLDFQGNVVAQ